MSGSIWIWRYERRKGPPLAGVWCGVSGNMVGMAAAGTKTVPDKSAKAQRLGRCLAVLRGLGACAQRAASGCYTNLMEYELHGGASTNFFRMLREVRV